MANKIKYSIVVPCHNEEENIKFAYDNITRVLDTTKEEYEIIFVDDGSKDNTLELIREYSSADKRVRGIAFSRNFGQLPAIDAGLKNAKGEAVINIDADLQDPPEVMLEMIDKWKEGNKVVIGKRRSRKGESSFKKMTSKLFGWFMKKLSRADYPENTGEFRLLDRQVVDTINSMKEHKKYLRFLTNYAGFKTTIVEFDRTDRKFGKTNYNLGKMARLATDSMIACSNSPLVWPITGAIILGLLGFAGFVTLFVLAMCKVGFAVSLWIIPTVIICTSIILFSLGIMGLYLGRVYDETKDRPDYIIESTINIKDKDE